MDNATSYVLDDATGLQFNTDQSITNTATTAIINTALAITNTSGGVSGQQR